MRLARLSVLVLLASLAFRAAPEVRAAGGTKDFEDKARGFSMKIPETFKQNPPKPTGDPKYKTASFYDDGEKYKSSRSLPEFNVGWWTTPKKATTPGGAGAPATTPDAKSDAKSDDDMPGRTFDDVLDFLLNNNPQLFGKVEAPASSAERWTQAKTAKTTKQKIDFKYWEFDPGKPKKGDKQPAVWYCFAARLTIDRPQETVEVTFEATCSLQNLKDLGPAYLNAVKSFETHDSSAGPARVEEAPDDPDQFREYFKRTKVIAGWHYMDSPKKRYILIYADGVDAKIVQTVAEQVESLREQVYEVMFPPDKPITAVSVIRICKDETQYMGYGAPGGSAGYWSSWERELVFYEDRNNKNDSVRVLYHEAFHQYIYYSVGACDPHSWFNEGHGDFFYGFNYEAGKWTMAKSKARVGDAATAKHSGKIPPLSEWLRWEQPQYYGSNKAGLTIYDNYALGWSLVYFLRTTKKPEYQGILQRYFDTLKGLVTAARAERMKNNPHKESPQEEEIVNHMHEEEWHEKAIVAGFQGVDLDQLYKDWIAN